MKKLPNKVTPLPKSAADRSPASFSDLIRAALDAPPPGGFTPSIMRARARVDEAMSKVEPGGLIELEDADFETAKNAVGSCPWQIRHADLLELFSLLGL